MPILHPSKEPHVSPDPMARPDDRRHAHCDIPCGIYDPHEAETGRPDRRPDGRAHQRPRGQRHAQPRNKFSPLRPVKEDHAEKVKHEVQVIWSDYFKPEHLEAYPDLHDKVWNCSSWRARTSRRRRRRRRPARGRGQGIRRDLLGDQEVTTPGADRPARVGVRGGRRVARARSAARGGSRSSKRSMRPRSSRRRLAARRPDDRPLAEAGHGRGLPRARRRPLAIKRVAAGPGDVTVRGWSSSWPTTKRGCSASPPDDGRGRLRGPDRLAAMARSRSTCSWPRLVPLRAAGTDRPPLTRRRRSARHRRPPNVQRVPTPAGSSISSPAARQSSANAACVSSVGDQRVGKHTRRSSPVAASAASTSTRAWPASRSSSSRAYSEKRRRRRIATLRLAASADVGHARRRSRRPAGTRS